MSEKKKKKSTTKRVVEITEANEDLLFPEGKQHKYKNYPNPNIKKDEKKKKTKEEEKVVAVKKTIDKKKKKKKRMTNGNEIISDINYDEVKRARGKTFQLWLIFHSKIKEELLNNQNLRKNFKNTRKVPNHVFNYKG